MASPYQGIICYIIWDVFFAGKKEEEEKVQVPPLDCSTIFCHIIVITQLYALFSLSLSLSINLLYIPYYSTNRCTMKYLNENLI